MIGPRGLRRTIVLILGLVLVMCLCMSTVAGEPSADEQQSTAASDEAKQLPSGSKVSQEDENKDEGTDEEEEEQTELVVESVVPSDSVPASEGTGTGSTAGSGSSSGSSKKDNRDNKDQEGTDASGIEIHRDPPSIQPETSGEGSSEGEGDSQAQSSIPKPQPESEEEKEDAVHSYTARWSDSAFSNQTMNYRDELIIGAGATYTIDPVRDVLITADGKAVGRLKGISVEYATSNKKYVQVDGSGHISGVKRGSAQVTVTIQFPDRSQKQLRKSVKVVDGPKISFAPNYAVLGNNGRLDLGQYANVPLLKASPNVYANVTYSIAPVDTAKYSKVRLDKSSGKLSATYQKPGDVYVITARTYGGEEATFTLYLGQRVQRIEIQTTSNTEGGRAVIYAGQSVVLKAMALAVDGEQAARQEVDWRVLEGTAAEIDRKGKLTALGDVVQEQLVVIGAFAVDGSEAYATMEVLVKP